MRKLIIAVIFLAVISPVFAQNRFQDATNVYYVNLPVEKVYPTSQGYVILYRTQRGFATLGIPNAWFKEAAGKADIVKLPIGSDWPTLSIFYADGEFSHLRLYIQRSRGHSSWGHIPQGTDLSRYFSDDAALNIRF
jgi:hypothetical protein